MPIETTPRRGQLEGSRLWAALVKQIGSLDGFALMALAEHLQSGSAFSALSEEARAAVARAEREVRGG